MGARPVAAPDGKTAPPQVTATYDVAIIGGGIVGLATARAITRRLPGAAVCVVEKETQPGTHQTGHNSGVLHTGLYYTPGSLRARLCVQGRRALAEFCDEAGLPLRRGGKVVVATTQAQIPRLEELHRRGAANGLRGLRRMTATELREVEPHAQGVAALHVPDAAVVDFAAVARRLAADLPGDVLLGAPLEAVELAGDVRLHCGGTSLSARLAVGCAGLHADRVARLAGARPSLRIIPFRGEYYRLTPVSAALVRSLIYPVPDPAFPFLGVHFTRRADGTVEVGPNAGPGPRAGVLPRAPPQRDRHRRDAQLRRVLAPRRPPLARRCCRGMALAVESRLRTLRPNSGARGESRRPAPRRRRSARPGGHSGRPPRGRFPDRGVTGLDPRAERTVAGGHGLPGHRGVRGRAGAAPARCSDGQPPEGTGPVRGHDVEARAESCGGNSVPGLAPPGSLMSFSASSPAACPT